MEREETTNAKRTRKVRRFMPGRPPGRNYTLRDQFCRFASLRLAAGSPPSAAASSRGYRRAAGARPFGLALFLQSNVRRPPHGGLPAAAEGGEPAAREAG